MSFISRLIVVQDNIYSDLSIINIDWRTEKDLDLAKREVPKHFQTRQSMKETV